MLATADTPGAYASLVRHVGRTSGRAYETPVVAMPVGDMFTIALPYGTRADWVRNVLAAGSATLVHGGAAYRVDQPEVVSTVALAEALPVKELRGLRLFHVDRCLRVRRVADVEPGDAVARGA
jgi:deazaflavin-dependent oxidoreductase (nitroreductase family)